MGKKKETIQAPMGETKVLLHTCCAPCSSAIIEAMMQNGITPVIFYCNPNIYPQEEYEIRKNECTRYAQSLGLEIIDDDYDHEAWLEAIKGMENEPERGGRCLKCFKIRLLRTAEYAAKRGIKVMTTTLASSRWKSLDQINEAGRWACSQINGRIAVSDIVNDGMPLGAVDVSRLGVETVPPDDTVLKGHFSAVPLASAKCSQNIEAAMAPVSDIVNDGMPLGAVDVSRLGVETVPPDDTVLTGHFSAVPLASAKCSQNIEAAMAPVSDTVNDGMPLGAVDVSRLGVETVPPDDTVIWWDHNWRKGGLQERRLQIIKEYDFYNQQYCGCEFSMRKDV